MERIHELINVILIRYARKDWRFQAEVTTGVY